MCFLSLIVSELCASRWLSLKESTHFLETRLMKTTGNPAEAGHAVIGVIIHLIAHAQWRATLKA